MCLFVFLVAKLLESWKANRVFPSQYRLNWTFVLWLNNWSHLQSAVLKVNFALHRSQSCVDGTMKIRVRFGWFSGLADRTKATEEPVLLCKIRKNTINQCVLVGEWDLTWISESIWPILAPVTRQTLPVWRILFEIFVAAHAKRCSTAILWWIG